MQYVENPLNEKELDELTALLDELPSADKMNVEMTDGYFAALLAGPEHPPASEYLPPVYGLQPGDETMPFSDAAKSRRIEELLQRHWQTMAAQLFGLLEKDEVYVPIMGEDEQGNITTLGRGGSDTTAVAVAAAIGADSCEIYTDVDGVYTTDPNVVPQARKLDKISYEEMLELAGAGAKVLQIRSVEFAMKYAVPLWVKSSFTQDPGTLVCPEDPSMEHVVVSGIAYDRNEAKVALRGVTDKPGVAARIFKPLADANIVVDLIIQNVGKGGHADMSFTVGKSDLAKAIDIVKRVLAELGGGTVETDDQLAKVSIVGVGMRNHAGVAAKAFDVLAAAGINIEMISTSEIKVSIVIAAKFMELAVRELHSAFELDQK